jgi:DNA polymerase-3 subunit gamma/tau
MNIHELDAASNNSVDDIRTLTDQVRIPPQIGKYSVYIIDEVHMLSAAAFNAFLKTLEEPPAHAIFILATTEKHKIIPTILSRCQIYDFNRIRVEDGVAYLKYVADSEGVKYDDESLNLITQKADGGMRDALSMFDKAVSFCGPQLGFKEVAQALNVLDYDTYFDITQILASGDYPSALTGFDRVLGMGFSGQTFMTGLSAHMRDLLMCKNPQTAPLLEITGSLLERYKQQAAGLDVQFLFGAIALLAELEGGFKTALNQRLHVELGLMKLCGLGQKKSDDLNEVVSKLPELQKDVEIAAPVVATGSAGGISTAAPIPAAEQPQPKPEAPAAPKPVAQSASSPLSGRSLADIMNISRQVETADDGTVQVAEEPEDPEAQHKIEHLRDKFLHALQAERPRMAPAFTDMVVQGSHIGVKAHSQELHDEIVRNKSEILDMLRAVAGVTGRLQMDVKVVENKGAKKPIKVEDRLRYLTEKNPLLTKLRKELDFEIE